MSFLLLKLCLCILIQKKDAETMKMNCETLHNIVLAEFDYLHRSLVADFRYIIALYLRKQADFHLQVSHNVNVRLFEHWLFLQLAERYELLHQSFMHMDTKFGCQPPMSSENGVDVPIKDPSSDGENSLENTSELQKKTPYLNFFPKSCYQNVQFKQTKGGQVEIQLVSNGSGMSTDKNVEEERISTSSSQPINSPPSVDPLSPSDTTAIASTPTPTGTSSVTSTTTSLSSNDTSKTALAVVEIHPTSTTSDQVVSPTTNASTGQSVATTTSSVSTSLSSGSNEAPISASSNPDDLNTNKVNSAVIEVGDLNPVYQSWKILKKNDSSEPVPIEAANKVVADSAAPSTTGGYDLMEPILKPGTYNSSVFLSAPSSVMDNQICESARASVPSAMFYENVVPIGNGKFTVTPPDSYDSKENLDFPLESSPTEQQTSLNRSNSTGSLLPQPTVQHHATFYSPAINRKDGLKYSTSLSAAVPVITNQPSDGVSKSACFSETDNINIRGSTAISKGSVKKKINLFESNTLPSGSKSLAELGILEDQDSDNGFVV